MLGQITVSGLALDVIYALIKPFGFLLWRSSRSSAPDLIGNDSVRRA